MTTQVLISGDQAIYNPQFGPVTAMVFPGVLIGSGVTFLTGGKPTCVQGDEASAFIICPYVKGPYVGGTGKITITQLGPDQVSTVMHNSGKPVLMKGTTFQAQFQVLSPGYAPSPNGPIPDVPATYPGTGQFLGFNITVHDTTAGAGGMKPPIIRDTVILPVNTARDTLPVNTARDTLPVNTAHDTISLPSSQ